MQNDRDPRARLAPTTSSDPIVHREIDELTDAFEFFLRCYARRRGYELDGLGLGPGGVATGKPEAS